MAVVSTSSPETLDPKPDKSDAPENPTHNPDPALPSAAVSSSPSPAPAENPNPDPPQNPNPSPVAPPPHSLPSFRPLGMPPAPQYTIPNPNPNPSPGFYYQNPGPASIGIQPPGVPVTVSMPPPMRQMYPPMPYSQVPNGYMTGPHGVPHPASSCYDSW